MRTFILLFLAMFTAKAWAQEHEQQPGPEFGTYGYKHGLLHEHGVIQELMRRTGSNCCDGGEGGECRATVVRMTPDKTWEFQHGNIWCPLNSDLLTMQFPDAVRAQSVSAVVCASKFFRQNGCPSATYCSAQGYFSG